MPGRLFLTVAPSREDDRAHCRSHQLRRGVRRRLRRRGLDDRPTRPGCLWDRRLRAAARRPDRRDRQLPGPVDDRAGQRRARRAPRWSPSTPTPAPTGAPRRSSASRSSRPRATTRCSTRNLEAAGVARPGPPPAQVVRATPSPTSTAPIDLLYIDGAHRYAPGPRRHPCDGARGSSPGGTLLIHDSFSSVGVTGAAAVAHLLGSWRYVGRSESMTEYRRTRRPGLGPGPQRRPAAGAAPAGSCATS